MATSHGPINNAQTEARSGALECGRPNCRASFPNSAIAVQRTWGSWTRKLPPSWRMCSGLTQHYLVKNMSRLGSSWKFLCPKAATMTYSFKNPVKVPLYIELEAMGSSFPFVVPGGRTVTKRVKFPKGCEGRQTTSSPRIARGRVIFRCSSFFNIAFAAPVEQELKS